MAKQKFIQLRCTAEKRRRLKQNAAAADLSLTAYLFACEEGQTLPQRKERSVETRQVARRLLGTIAQLDHVIQAQGNDDLVQTAQPLLDQVLTDADDLTH